jgi:hypothetical protein
MIAALATAAAAPLRDRPNASVAEVAFVAERDHRSPFAVALELWAQDARADLDQPLLPLTGAAR